MRFSISLFLLIYCPATSLFAQTESIDALIRKDGTKIYGHFLRFEAEQVLFTNLNGASLRIPFLEVKKIVKGADASFQIRSSDSSPREHLRSKFESSISLSILSSTDGQGANGGRYFGSLGSSLILGMGYRLSPHIYLGLDASFERMNIVAMPLLGQLKLNLNKRAFSPYAILGAGRYQETNTLWELFEFGLRPEAFKGLTTRNGIGFDLQLNSSSALSFFLVHRYYLLQSNFDSWNNAIVTKARLHRLALGFGLHF